MSSGVDDCVLTRTDEGLSASLKGMGPFGGLHGGVVSGLLVGEGEIAARKAGMGPLVSAHVYLLRPAPREGLATALRDVKSGKRLALWENELFAGGKLQAKASLCFLGEAAVAGLLEVPQVPAFDPAALPLWVFTPSGPSPFPEGTRGYLDAVEIRDDGAGTKWLRSTTPIFAEPAPCATALSFADFATLFWVRDLQTLPPLGGWPNADISVHLARPPKGEWIGVKPRSDWYNSGAGVTETEIYDVYGRIGRVCQAVALSPAGPFI